MSTKRPITIAAILASVSVAAISLWMYAKDPLHDRQAVNDQMKSNAMRLVNDGEKEIPAAHKLDVRMAVFSDGLFGPCYFDFEKKTLYRWKGVFLPKEDVPGGPISGLLTLNASEFTVTPIDAPVKYRLANGGFRPGYLHRSYRIFYEFKGIVLKKEMLLEKSQDGLEAIVDAAVFRELNPRVIEIELPHHLSQRPELWKKLGSPELDE